MKRSGKRRLGFTLLEVVIVLVVLAILAAIAVPSLYHFWEAGRQANRMNVARTVYLAAQNQLTHLRVTRGLKAAQTEYYDANGELIPGYASIRPVYKAEGPIPMPPNEDPDNETLVHFISKPRGPWDTTAPALMRRLLSPMVSARGDVDRGVLDNAILIEYNIETGVVLSVFYGDAAQAELNYGGDDSDSEPTNIVGPRGMGPGGYPDGSRARDRRQGYYGVDNTSQIGEFDELLIFLKDTCNPGEGLPDDAWLHANKNALYVDILIPVAWQDHGFTLSVPGVTLPSSASFVPSGVLPMPGMPGTPGAEIYQSMDTGPEAIRIVYILDQVLRDTESDYVGCLRSTFVNPASYITAKLTDTANGVWVESGSKHPFYSGGTDGNYTITSARHLYNVRFAPDANFTLLNDIGINTGDSSDIFNFAPIPAFSGRFSGNGRAVSNLRVSLPAGTSSRAGLFGTVSGSAGGLVFTNPVVSGGGDAGALCGELSGGADNITVSNAAVSGGGSAGALCGTLSGSADSITVSNPNVAGANAGGVCGGLSGGARIVGAYVKYDTDRFITGADSAGGIAGSLETGQIVNVTFISPLPEEHIKGSAVKGGIAGHNGGGTVMNALFLALAPKTGSGSSEMIYPIIGDGNNTAGGNTYYLKGEPIRPEPGDPVFKPLGNRDGYNREKAYGDIGEPKGTWALYDELNQPGGYMLGGWTKKPGLSAAEEVDCRNVPPYLPIYPYPFLPAQESILPGDPYWPIAEDDDVPVDLIYCEIYSGDLYGDMKYDKDAGGFDVAASTLRNDADAVVKYDGYALVVTDFAGKDVKIQIEGDDYEISGLDFAAVAPAAVTGGGYAGTWQVHYYVDPGNENKETARIYIPNEFLEDVSGKAYIASGKAEIKLTASDFEAEFNPAFAPAEAGLIRSPRHIDNIDLNGDNLKASYVQRLDADFGIYRREILSAGTIYAAYTYRASMAEIGEAVVNGTFTGQYDGGGKEIRNLKITGGGNTGLFAAIENDGTAADSGTVENVTLVNVSIDVSGGYAGGVAGMNGGTIRGAALVNAHISGGDYTGGIAGMNGGVITHSSVGVESPSLGSDNTVSGGNSVGGIAGKSTGTIEICYVDYTQVEGSNTVGGIAGAVEGIVRNVFFNYGTADPQTTGWVTSVTGADASTGGLAGTISGAGSLQSAYTDAFFGNASNPVVGTGYPGAIEDWHLVYYLTGKGYNNGASSKGTPVMAEDMKTVLWSLSTLTWREGYGSANDIADRYQYPCLSDFVSEPEWWPEPEGLTFDLLYYERYGEENPLTGSNYGFWDGDGEDTLNDGLKILEDGYLLRSEEEVPIALMRLKTGGGGVISLTNDKLKAEAVPGLYYYFIPMDAVEAAAGSNLGIAPVRLTVTYNPAASGCYYDGYFNPLFAKAVYGNDAAPPAGRVVRTPRHLYNVGRNPDTLSGDFTQERDLDFAKINAPDGYHIRGMTYTADGWAWDLSGYVNLGSPAADVSVFTVSAVSGAFAGNYDGDGNAIRNLAIESAADNIGVFSQIGAGGAAQNLALERNDITGGGYVGGLAGTNGGTISNSTATYCKVSGTADYVGGLAGMNGGTIDKCSVTGILPTGTTSPTWVNISGGGESVGGIAGSSPAGSSITAVTGGYTVQYVNITGAGQYAGGITGSGGIGLSGFRALYVNVKGDGNHVGGIAGFAAGDVRQCAVEKSTVNGGGNNVGGIAGNGGAVSGCAVRDSDVTGGGNNVGGIIGLAMGNVSQCAVEYGAVTGGAANVGGIMGYAGNTSTSIKDVYLLGIDAHDDSPVSGVSEVGGIAGNAGNNNNTIARAFYIAPAPVSGGIIRPIKGGGAGYVDRDCFFLSGNSYTLEGHLPSSAQHWVPDQYNTNAVEGGGTGLQSEFIDYDFLNEVYLPMVMTGVSDPLEDAWEMSQDTGYPYPVLTALEDPEEWQLVNAAARQVDRDGGWADTHPADLVGIVDFINGDFDLPLVDPNSGQTSSILGGGSGGWNTGVGSWNPNPGWAGWPNYAYHRAEWVQGWNTRPTNTADYASGFWGTMEFQRPRTDGNGGIPRTSYTGGTDGLFAELNAEVQGTLYQITKTAPGSEIYYSFYNAARRKENDGWYSGLGTRFYANIMNFYLSDMVPDGLAVGGYSYKDGLAIIRPCITPCITTNNRGEAPPARAMQSTIVYGSIIGDPADTTNTWQIYLNGEVACIDGNHNIPDPDGRGLAQKVEFYDPHTRTQRTAYLYDVWVAGLGYGVTFWSDSSYQVDWGREGDPAGGKIPQYGVDTVGQLAQFGYAENRVIGYWKVETGGSFPMNGYSEWKQYYGLYTVPGEQTFTEFAFESRSAEPEQGNYLDGITFQAPAFLTIDKYVRAASGSDAKFVSPNDRLTVELHVKNHGEIEAGGIRIEDQLAPFDAYLDAGNIMGLTVTKDGNLITPAVTLPSAANGWTLSVTPGTLKYGETIVVRFQIDVREWVNGTTAEGSTLGLYFRNQGVVQWNDAGARAPYNIIRTPAYSPNGSDKDAIKVYISPIGLEKTAVGTDVYDGRLTVLDISDGQNTNATGIVTVVMRDGFTAYKDGAEVGSRITFNANIEKTGVKSVDYPYILQYTGSKFGVMYDTVSATYRYVYVSEGVSGGDPVVTPVLMDFPRTAVGIAPKPAPKTVTVNTHGWTQKPSGEQESFTADFLGDYIRDNMLGEDGYALSALVGLRATENGAPATVNANGNIELRTGGYIIELVHNPSTNTVQINITPPANGGPGSYTYPSGTLDIYYTIDVTATKPGSPDISLESGPVRLTINVTDEDAASGMAGPGDQQASLPLPDGSEIPAMILPIIFTWSGTKRRRNKKLAGRGGKAS
ncbi:MAG: prepilin-type N-terminal cleavage/methylation domain-containing protein [Oscillospiraceae bacterium]|jgi:prepilin-type N-terminal cleavage/methylation domain-containing protein|nr:prepilin-type N-terminal cleavage/methylation domain-containing protein [Oscillospiraceae bacterium]